MRGLFLTLFCMVLIVFPSLMTDVCGCITTSTLCETTSTTTTAETTSSTTTTAETTSSTTTTAETTSSTTTTTAETTITTSTTPETTTTSTVETTSTIPETSTTVKIKYSSGGKSCPSRTIEYMQRAKIVSSCFDDIKNYGETDVDCGGPCKKKCGSGKGCKKDSDCESGWCNEGICETPSCTDGILNQDEEEIDCGGSCDPCPSCTDGIQNQEEEGVDCGGPCHPCCPTCFTCSDGLKNQGETDIDCGGACNLCADYHTCSRDSDCESGWCNEGICETPSCTDGILNQDEEEIDCGGSCDPCESEGVGVVGHAILYSAVPYLMFLILLIPIAYVSYHRGRKAGRLEEESDIVDELLTDRGMELEEGMESENEIRNDEVELK